MYRRMKTNKKLWMLIFIWIAAANLCAVQAKASGADPLVSTETSSEVPDNVSSWVQKNGKKYYYDNGKKVTGWKKIEGKKYYFNSKGVLQVNKMISKNKFVNKKGELVPKSKIYSNGKNSLKKLKTKLQKKVKGYSGTYSIYVKNLDTNEYLSINNKKITAASLIKLYNMGTVYEQIQKKKLKNSKSIRSYLKSMITVSSNDSYNILLNKIGKGNTLKGARQVSKFCKAHGYKNTTCGGTLSPSYYRPAHTGTGTKTTTRDCGHILEDIYRGNLVSSSASSKMLSLLKKQTRRGKIPAGLPSKVKTANKTGETSDLQHDAAIVFSKNADYILVVMSEGDSAAVGHIRTLSKITYNYFN